jgi:hypothetical protein
MPGVISTPAGRGIGQGEAAIHHHPRRIVEIPGKGVDVNERSEHWIKLQASSDKLQAWGLMLEA